MQRDCFHLDAVPSFRLKEFFAVFITKICSFKIAIFTDRYSKQLQVCLSILLSATYNLSLPRVTLCNVTIRMRNLMHIWRKICCIKYLL